MGKNSESTGRNASRPKADKKTTAKKKSPAQQTSKDAVTKDVAARKASVPKKAAPKAAGQEKAAAKKPGAKKPGAKKPAAKKVAPKATQRILASERHQMIAEAAYLRAEARGFASDQHEDWLMAEAEVDARLAKAGRKVID
jgi:hypothetical protein